MKKEKKKSERRRPSFVWEVKTDQLYSK